MTDTRHNPPEKHMPTEFRVDDEFAALVPPQTEEEFAQMEANCRDAGKVEDALIVWKGHGLLIDGHHRFRVAHEHGLPFTVKEQEFPGREAVMRWMICRALGCRSLTTFARVELALKLKPMIEAEAKRRAESGGKGDPVLNSGQGKTNEIIGKKANVSADTVRKVQAVLDKADEPTKAAARAKTISIEAAHKAATAPKPKIVTRAEYEAGGPPPLDRVGRPIPAINGLRELFARAGEVTHILSAISDTKATVLKAVADKDKLYASLNVSDFQTAMERARGAILSSRPHAVCPYCAGGDRGAGKHCNACKGHGWLGKFAYAAVPRELKAGAAEDGGET